VNRNHRFYAVRSAFYIIEAIVAMAIVGFMVVALVQRHHLRLFQVRFARENLRATQIMVERWEVIRLCTWTRSIPAGSFHHFHAPYFPNDFTTNSYIARSARVFDLQRRLSSPR